MGELQAWNRAESGGIALGSGEKRWEAGESGRKRGKGGTGKTFIPAFHPVYFLTRTCVYLLMY